MSVPEIVRWLRFGGGRRIDVLLQDEPAECGLACLGMIASYFGHRADLPALRRKFNISLRGARLSELMGIANRMHLATRAIRVEAEAIGRVTLPCIAHWRFDHFVVITEVKKGSISIIDPARGIRSVSSNEFFRSFTGVTLELWPNPGFEIGSERQTFPLRTLLGHVTGLARSLSQTILLAVALEIFAILSPFYLQWIIDDVLASADRSLLNILGIAFGLLVLLQALLGTLRSWMLIYLGATLNVQWRSNVFTHLLRLPGSYFGRRHLGDIVSRFMSIDSIQRTLTTSFAEAFLDGFVTLATLTLIFIYSTKLAGIVVVAIIAYGAIRYLSYMPLKTATEQQIIQAAKQQSHFIETVRGAKPIKIFERQFQRRSSWLTLLVDQLNADIKSQEIQLYVRAGNTVLLGVENVVIIYLGAKLVMGGNFTIGMLTAFLSYKGQCESRVSSLIDRIVEFKMLKVQGARIADIVLTAPENESAINDDGDERGGLAVRLKDVVFRYSDSEPAVLDGINLDVAPGEAVAIIGESGCGKSTLLNLLLGLNGPSSGEIWINGRNISHHPARGLIAAVTQDDTLLEGSLAENISFFDDRPDRKLIEHVAEIADIHKDILSMPMGYNTFVGYLGSVLSGGQKQRILIARALYKRPRLLILDEATSNLDIACERKIAAALRDLEITRIIVAHRPQTIESADRILRLTAGALAEERSQRAGAIAEIEAIAI